MNDAFGQAVEAAARALQIEPRHEWTYRYWNDYMHHLAVVAVTAAWDELSTATGGSPGPGIEGRPPRDE